MLQRAVAARRRIAFDHIAQVNGFGDFDIAAEVDARVMVVDLVRAADEIAHRCRRMVEIDRYVESDRADKSGRAAGSLVDRRRTCHRQR